MKVGYAERKGKTIIATDKGVQLIEIMPEELSSPAMTGKWELALEQISSGQQDAEQFLDGIKQLTTSVTKYAISGSKAMRFAGQDSRKRGKSFPASPVEGVKCPLCGQGAVNESRLAFSCDHGKPGCCFTLWKDCLTRGGGPVLNDKIIQLLLQHGQVRGSSGVVMIYQNNILFYPNGS